MAKTKRKVEAPKLTQAERDAFAAEWYGNAFERQHPYGAEARLDRMERVGREARDNPNARLFQRLVRVAPGVWRTPYAIREHG